MRGIKLIVGLCALLMAMSVVVQAAALKLLTPAEVAGMIYIRQEEKLERDVYLDLANTWNIPLFDIIANAEQGHMNSILALLNNYGISDPVAGAQPGQFPDPVLARFYQSMVTQDEVSMIYALNVGAETEEICIGELMLRLSQTNKRDIQIVYNNLRLASANHLRAFVAELSRNGITYRPQHLAPALYKIIVYGYGTRGRPNRIPSGM